MTAQQLAKRVQSIIRAKTKASRNVICPKCGVLGQLKRRAYYYKRKKTHDEGCHVRLFVDHYASPRSHSSAYVRCCSMGQYTPALEQLIRSGDAGPLFAVARSEKGGLP